jgi:hypothetical protein
MAISSARLCSAGVTHLEAPLKAPKSLFKQLSVNVPEELEMESVSFQDFQEAKFNFDNPSPKNSPQHHWRLCPSLPALTP